MRNTKIIDFIKQSHNQQQELFHASQKALRKELDQYRIDYQNW